jgi:hypothetical protein
MGDPEFILSKYVNLDQFFHGKSFVVWVEIIFFRSKFDEILQIKKHTHTHTPSLSLTGPEIWILTS